MPPHRVDRLASAIREIIGHAISHQLNDPRISQLTSITRVEVSGDLQIAKVFISVMGQPSQGRTTLAGLKSAVGHIQRLLAQNIQMRRCPEVRFLLDESLKKAAETVRLIDRTMADDALHRGEQPSAEQTNPDLNPDESHS